MNRKNKWWVTVIISVLIIAAVIALLLIRPNCSEDVKKHTVTFISRDAVYDTVEVKHGENVPFESIENPADYEDEEDGITFVYTFIGWYLKDDASDALVNESVAVTQDITFIAAFDSAPKDLDPDTYIVRFYDSVTGKLMIPDEGEAVQYVKKGESAIEPKAPNHEEYEYPPEWSRNFNNVTGNLKVVARYLPKQFNVNKHILGEIETDREYFNVEMRPGTPGDRGMLKFVDWYWTPDFSGEPVPEDALMQARDMDVYAKYRIDFGGVLIAHVGGDFAYGGTAETLMLDGIIPDNRLEYSCEWTAYAPDKTTSEMTAQGEEGTLFNLVNGSGRDISGEYAVKALLKAKYKSADGADVLVSDEVTVSQNINIGKRDLSAEISRNGSNFTYGTAPDVSLSFSGFEYDDNSEIFDGRYAFTFTKDQTILKEKLPVGIYTVSAEIEEAANYSVNIVNDNSVTIQIDRKDLKVSLDAEDFTYGEGEVTSHFEIDYDSFVYGENENVQEIIGLPIYAYTHNNQSYNAAGHTYVDAGSYTVKITGFTKVPSGNVGLNYTVNWRDANSTFEVEKREVAVSLELEKDSLIYGEKQTYRIDDEEILEEDRESFGWDFSFVFNSADGTRVKENYKHNSGSLFEAGSYTVTASCVKSNENYKEVSILGNTSSFTVAQRDLTVSAQLKQEYEYGETPAAEAVFNGFVSGGLKESDLKESEGVKYSFKKEEQPYSHEIFGVGEYTAEYVSGYTSNNYKIIPGEAFAFAVTPKTLNVTLNKDKDADYYYGDKPQISVAFNEDEFVFGDGNKKDEIFPADFRTPEYYLGGSEYEEEYFNANATYNVYIGLRNGQTYGNNLYGNGNYLVKINDLSFKVIPRPVTLTLSAGNGIYGEAAPVYNYETTSQLQFIDNDEAAFNFSYVLSYIRFNESGSHSFTPADGTLYPAGQYHVTLHYSENPNYKINVVSASFEVSRRAVTVDLSAKGITYGEEVNFTYAFTKEGETNGVLKADEELFKSAYKYSLTKNGSPYTHSGRYYGAGDYTYKVDFASENSDVADLLKNYEITYSDGREINFKVNKKALYLYVDFSDIVYGQKVVAPKPTSIGFAEGEDLAVLNGEIKYTLNGNSYSVSQFENSPIPYSSNGYTILIEEGCYTSENYNINYNKNGGGAAVSEKFSVSKRNATISAEMKSAGEYVYGGENKPQYGYVFTVADLNGKESFDLSLENTKFKFRFDVKYSNDYVKEATYSAGGKYNAGVYTVTVAIDTSDPNFNITNANNKITFTVDKAELNVRLNNISKSYEYGVAVSPEVVFSGFVSGDDKEAAKIELVHGTSRNSIFRYKNGATNINSVKNVGDYSAFIANDKETYYKSENYNFVYDSAEHKFSITAKTLHAWFDKTAELNYDSLVYGDVRGTESATLFKLAFNSKDMVYDESAETLFSHYDRTVAYYVDEQHYTPGTYFAAGTYTLKVKELENGGTYGNYTLEIAEETLVIGKRILSVSKVDDASYEYDGSAHRVQKTVTVSNLAQGETAADAYAISYTFENEKEYKTVDSYKVSFSVTPTSNYDVAEHVGYYFVNITPKKIIIAAQAGDGTYGDFRGSGAAGGENNPVTSVRIIGGGFVNGESFAQINNPDKNIAIFKDSNSEEYKLSETGYYDAGSYIVKIHNLDKGVYSYGNYEVTVRPCSFKISPKTITISDNRNLPRLKGERWTWTYTKSEGDFFEFTGSVRLKDFTGKNYNADSLSTFESSFEWVEGDYDIKINGISVKENFALVYNLSLMLNDSKFEITPPGSKEYNGANQSFAISVTTEGDEEDVEGLYTIQYSESGTQNWSDSAPQFKDVTTKTWYYQIISTYSHSVEDSGDFKISITPKALSVVKPEDVERVYNSVAEVIKTLEINGVVESDGLPYTISKAEITGSAAEGEIVNVGVYTVSYTVNLTSQNYSLTVKDYSYNITISKANLVIDTSGIEISGLKYNGEEQTIENLPGKVVVKQGDSVVTFAQVNVSGNTFINAYGEHKIVFSFEESENYGGEDVELEYSVAKADYTVAPNKPLNDLIYNGQRQSYGINVSVIKNSDEYSLSYSYNGSRIEDISAYDFINAKVYKISYTVTGNNNYNDITGEYSFEIKPKQVTVQAPGNVEETYDGAQHGASVSVTGYEEITSQLSDVYSISYVTENYGDNHMFINVLREEGEVCAYVVNYTVTLNSNYTALEDLQGSFTVKINPAKPVFSDTDLKQWTYDGTTVANAPETSQGGDKTAPKVEYWLEETESSLILKGFMKAAAENWQSGMPVIKDAGTYILHIRLSGDNYETLTFEKQYTIEKAEYTLVEETLPEGVNKTFDNNAAVIQKDVKVNGVVESDTESLVTASYKYTYDFTPYMESEDIHSIEGGVIDNDTAFINAGTYTVHCTVEASRNYNEYSCSYTITIEQAQGTIDTSGITKEYTYNGTEQEVSSGADTNSDGILSYSNNTFTDVGSGSQVVTITLSETNNYKGASENVTITISKAALTVTLPEDYSKTYDGSAYTFGTVGVEGAFQDNGVYSVSYKYNTGEEDSESSSALPQFKDAAKYTVTVTVTLSGDYSENYTINEYKNTAVVTILPKEISFGEPANVTKNYDTQPEEIQTLSEPELVAGDNKVDVYSISKYSITKKGSESFSGEIKNAGEYTVTYTVTLNSRNYCLKDSKTEYSYTITISKADYTVIVNKGEDLTYNGTEQGYDIMVKGVGDDISVAGATVTYSDGNGANTYKFINADKYEVSYTIAETDNYNEMTGSYTITIAKANYGVEFENYSNPYNGSAQGGEPSITVTTKVPGDKEKYTITYRKGESGDFVEEVPTATNVLESTTVYFRISGDSNYNDYTNSYTLNITKATLTELPEGVEAPHIDEVVVRREGRNLNSVCSLNKNWKWADGTDTTFDLTNDSYIVTAIYTDPSGNYEPYEYEITFATRKEKITITYNGDAFETTFNKDVENVLNNFTVRGEEDGFSSESITAILTNYNKGLGSTYLATVTFSVKESDYFELSTTSLSDIIVKVKSVYIGDASYTIEDALNAAQSGQTITVKNNTSFAEKYDVAKVAGYYSGENPIEDYYTIKVGVTLLLPYDGTNTHTYIANSDETGRHRLLMPNDSNAETYKKLELIITKDTEIINNGTIIVGGITSGGNGGSLYAGQTCSDYAQITLENNSKITSNNELKVFGFIAESAENNGSQVVVENGSLNIPFVVVEHRGGSVFAGMYKEEMKGSPFNRFFMPNVTPFLKLTYSSKLLGHANLYAGSQNNFTDIKLVGNSNTYLIELKNNSYITSKYSIQNSVTDLNLYGNATINSLELSVSGTNVGTKSTMFPISYYWKVALNSIDNAKTVVDIPVQDIKLMPGATVIVNKNVTLNAQDISVYNNSYKDPSTKDTGLNYPSGKGDGQFIINGELVANAVNGNFTAGEDGAKLTIKDNKLATYELLSSDGKSIFATATFTRFDSTLQGKIYNYNGNSALQTLPVGTMIARNSAWITDDSKFEIKYVFKYQNSEGVSIESVEGASANNPATYTIVDNYELQPASHMGYEFIGWYSNEDCTESIETFVGSSYNYQSVTLYGLFKQLPEGTVSYELTLDPNHNGENSVKNVILILSTKLEEFNLSEKTPTREGYKFLGWYKESDGTTKVDTLSADSFKDNKLTLYAKWEVLKFKLTLNIGTGTTLTVTANGVNVSSGTEVEYGATIVVTAKLQDKYKDLVVSSTPAGLAITDGSTFTMPAEPVIIKTSATKDSGGCIAEGTLITLADGTQKPVEDLLPTDSVLIFNHFTGKYEAGTILFDTHANRPASEYIVTNLKFSNGTTLRIVMSHGLFDLDLNRYVYLDHNNAEQFIGHKFATAEQLNGGFVAGETVLTEVVLTQEFIKIYSPMTVIHFNVVAESMLTITSFMVDGSEYGVQGFVNIFDYEEGTLKYDEAKMQADIEKYGLFTYEDFKDLIPEELFEASVWRYFKVAIGKGNLKWQQVLDAIEYILHSGEV